MTDDETRDEIEEIVNDGPVQEPVQRFVQEEEVKPVKAKSKAKAKAKPKIKITKQPVEPVTSVEPVEPESSVAVEETPKNNDKLKKLFNSPDCNLNMT